MNKYSDGTPVTAPFWLVKCTEPVCLHETWAVLYHDTCLKCGQPAVCIPANQDKKLPA